MFSHAPEHALPAGSIPRSAADIRAPGAVESLLHWLQCGVCSLRGHDPVLQYDRTRIYLRCTSCGHETPGWDVAPSTLPGRRPYAKRAQSAHAGLSVVRKIA
ncbi:MAG TPA: hypothetical protein VGK32_16210 [Vicinamibacterales bacterium]|jgi:hypothetical protein